MSQELDELRKRVLSAPMEPGVYRWLNAKGDIIYVGKAKNLKNRMLSYVQSGLSAEASAKAGPWKLSLIKNIADFDVTITTSELEALILETNLIKEIQPKYNVLMKDGKSYVYVRISTKDQYPSISIVRKMEDDKAAYFGPYLTAYNIKRTLDMLHDVFRYRACEGSVLALNKEKKVGRACLEYQIGKCNGLCVGDVTKKQYREGIEEVMRFLKGDYATTVLSLKDMMEVAATEKKFERAGKLRDTLKYIATLNEQQTVSDTSREDTDAIGMAVQNGKVQVVVLHERNGRVVDERSFAVSGESDSVSDALSQLIPQLYSSAPEIPDLVVIPEEPEDIAVLEEWLTQMRGKKVELRAAERGKKSKLLALAQSNATQKISQQFAKWEAASKNIADALEDLKDTLKLPGIPSRIEGYDISHLGGTETVGSMVVIKNGKPANPEYRSFTIRTMQSGEIDDYKALKEVLRRRLHYLVEENTEIVITKLKKKEREEWSADKKKRLEVPKDWKEEVLVVRENETELLTLDLRKSAKDKIIYGTIDIQTKDDALLHSALDTLEKEIGKREWYLCCQTDVDTDMFALHGLMDSVKKMPDHFKSNCAHMFHRRKTISDASLNSTPDLLVIDGGKGQLSSVKEVLDELKMTIPVIGLAKREEEVFLPGQSLPEDLPKNSQASFLLQRLRNEAHRFANSHREKRIAKGLIGSALDSVPGIGDITKKELLQKFGSVAGIIAAPDAEILKIVNTQKLEDLRKHLT
jgi:excinuclease ABC subunit C